MPDDEPLTPPSETTATTVDDTAWWIATAETCVMITAAGFVGSLVGMAKEKQHQELTVVRRAARRHRVTPTNLPVTWSVGCMVFVAVLESSRRASPAGIILEQAPMYIPQSVQVHTNVPEVFSNPIVKQTAITIADYGIGGTVAGLAGAIARRTAFVYLTSTGFVLGILAGVVQAASNAVEEYWVEEANPDDAVNTNSNEED